MKTIRETIGSNPYPGRGIIIGMTGDGKAVYAYFISGRSENSRNRIFEEDEKGDIYTRPFDESKVEDPSLIIYRAVANMSGKLIVTNGDQTDTLADFMEKGKSSAEALATRKFEPDMPNFTPRISGVLDMKTPFSYEMSILKSADEKGSACSRFFYRYEAMNGKGHIIHTYEGDGNPLPTFCGEPREIKIADDIDAMTEEIWTSLNEDNRISLFVAYTDLEKMTAVTRLINKNGR